MILASQRHKSNYAGVLLRGRTSRRNGLDSLVHGSVSECADKQAVANGGKGHNGDAKSATLRHGEATVDVRVVKLGIVGASSDDSSICNRSSRSRIDDSPTGARLRIEDPGAAIEDQSGQSRGKNRCRHAVPYHLTRTRSAASGEGARRCGLKGFSHMKAEQYDGPASAASRGCVESIARVHDFLVPKSWADWQAPISR